MKLFILFIFVLFYSCSFIPKNIDKEQEYLFENGFKISFDILGSWYPVQKIKGDYFTAKKGLSKSQSILGIVKPGKVNDGKSLDENLTKLQIELQKAEKDKIAQVKSEFKRVKLKEADCLSFHQNGVDELPTGKVFVEYLGLICLHPRRTDEYLLMAFNERYKKGDKRIKLKPYLDRLTKRFSYF